VTEPLDFWPRKITSINAEFLNFTAAMFGYVVPTDLATWPSPSCKFPDWLSRVTWRDLTGQYRLTVDGDALVTSLMTSSSRGRRRGQSVTSEHRCLVAGGVTNAALTSEDEELVILSLSHHNWLVLLLLILLLLLGLLHGKQHVHNTCICRPIYLSPVFLRACCLR